MASENSGKQGLAPYVCLKVETAQCSDLVTFGFCSKLRESWVVGAAAFLTPSPPSWVHRGPPWGGGHLDFLCVFPVPSSLTSFRD